MILQLLCCTFYTALFAFIIYKYAFFRLPGIKKTNVLLFFVLKVLCATIAWKVFLIYYPVSDVNNYLSDGQLLYATFFENKVNFFKLFFGVGNPAELQAISAKMIVWNNTSGSFLIVDTRTMIRIYALLRFFTFGYFYVQAIIMSFFSFVGMTYLYKSFFPYFESFPPVLIIACFLFPSVVFWSSTALKEGALFLGMGVMLYHCQFGLRNNYTRKNMIGFAFGCLLLIMVKFYVFLAMLPALLANFWIACSNHKRVILKYSLVYIFFLMFMSMSRFISPSLDIAKVLNTKQKDFVNVAKGGMVIYHDTCLVYLDYDLHKDRLEEVGSNLYKLKKGYQYASFKWGKTDTVFIDASDTNTFAGVFTLIPARSKFIIPKIKPQLMDILKQAPVAFANTFIVLPLFEIKRAFSDFILFENLLLILGLFLAFFFLKKQIPLAVVFFCASFIFILFALIGLTTPVLGALVRYRIPAIPFLVILIGLLADDGKIRRGVLKLKQRIRHRESEE